MRMDDVRLEVGKLCGDEARQRQPHREIAAVEVLDRRNADDVGFVGRLALELRGHDDHAMARGRGTRAVNVSTLRATPPTCGRYVLVIITMFMAAANPTQAVLGSPTRTR